MLSGDYPTPADYIRGEYYQEFAPIRKIIYRHLKTPIDDDVEDALVLDIVGYYTGCLRSDGTPRLHHRTERA